MIFCKSLYQWEGGSCICQGKGEAMTPNNRPKLHMSQKQLLLHILNQGEICRDSIKFLVINEIIYASRFPLLAPA